MYSAGRPSSLENIFNSTIVAQESATELNSLVEYLVDSINKGKTEDLIKQGFKVTNLHRHGSSDPITGNSQ